MLNDLIQHVAESARLEQVTAREAVAIVLNTAERQGAPLVEQIYAQVPGARTLAESPAAREATPTGPLARLIEQTPGGKRHVALEMFKRLHMLGLGHSEVSQIMTALGSWTGAHSGRSKTALLVELFETERPSAPEQNAAVA